MKILSLDGGGIRGIISAVWLQELQRKLDKPIYETFDLIAGTSTGAILAVALGLGMDPGDILSMYLEKAPLIFPQNKYKRIAGRISRLFRGHGFSQPKYDDIILNSILKDILGHSKFGDMKTNIIVPAYDLEHMQSRVFKSWRNEYKDLSSWEIVRASAAAPTYLSAYKMVVMGRETHFVDGGVIANNPSMCAVAEAMRLGSPKEDILLVSLGTGQGSNVFAGEELEHWGPIQWATNIITVLIDGNNDVQNYHVSMLLNGNSFRFQMTLPKENYRLDKATKKNLNELEVLARRYWNRSDTKVKVREIINRLS